MRPLTDPKPRLWQVETGVLYWVRAPNVAQALVEVRNCEAAQGSDEFDELDGAEVTELTEECARKLTCHGDGDPDTDMWTAFQAHGRDGVVACSEWP